MAKKNQFKLPKWKIECASLLTDSTIELCGFEEGQYLRLTIPEWLRNLLDDQIRVGQTITKNQIREALGLDKDYD